MKNSNEATELTLKFTNQEARDYFPLLLHEIATIHLETIKSLPPDQAEEECDMFPEPINGWLKVEYANADFDQDTEDEEA